MRSQKLLWEELATCFVSPRAAGTDNPITTATQFPSILPHYPVVPSRVQESTVHDTKSLEVISRLKTISN
jgi:hypothetical protein